MNTNNSDDGDHGDSTVNLTHQAAVSRLFDICCGQSLSSPDELERLLQKYPNAVKTYWEDGMELPINTTESDEVASKSPIHIACLRNAPVSVVRALVNAWPDSVREIVNFMVPLHFACHCGKSLETIQLLVEAWPDSIRHYQCGRIKLVLLPLHLALQSAASIDIIQFLVQQWPESVQLLDHNDYVALHWACRCDSSLAVIRFLVEQWPEALRMKCCYGLPLHLACASSKSVDIVAFLINAWPDAVQVRNALGSLPLRVAYRKRRQGTDVLLLLIDKWPDAVRILYEEKQELLLLKFCKLKTAVALIQALAKAWPDAVRLPDKHGFQPLHHACSVPARCLQTIQFLVELCPESLAARTNLGMLPLHIACCDPIAPIDVICYLLGSFSMSVRVQDHNQRLPLHLACGQKSPLSFETIECLVQAWPESVLVVCHDDHHWRDRNLESSGHPLALDLACIFQKPSRELVRLLADDTPPLHFVSASACTVSEMHIFRLVTIDYLISMFPEDKVRYHQGMLPFHFSCRAKAPLFMLLWWSLEQCPEAICMHTADTNDTPLHCYLLPPIRRTGNEITKRPRNDVQLQPVPDLSTVKYLVRNYPEALLVRNRSGWLPLHVAALNEAPLDVLLFLVTQTPELFRNSTLSP